MSPKFVWTPALINQLLSGRWVNADAFQAEKVVTSSKRPVEGALFIGYTDTTFRRYMGDANYVHFAREGKKFSNLLAARRAAAQGWPAAMIVDKELSVAVPQFVVDDAFAALEALASYKRSLLTAPVIAVTGTVGKTSTLRALDAALGDRAARVSSRNVRSSLAVGLANVPVKDGPSFFLAEVSVSALWGESGGISPILRPDVAVLTEIGLGMTHRVPTERDTAVVKTNLINGMSGDGLLLYNSEMKHADYVRERGEKQPVQTRSFGFGTDADYRIVDTGHSEDQNGSLYQTGKIIMAGSATTLSIPAFGKAHLYANSAAMAVADTLGEDLEAISSRTVNYQASKTSEQIVRVFDKNLQVDHHIVDGTFSATPISMRNSFDLAAQIRNHSKSGQGELVGVLARIVALGDQAEETHLSFAGPLIAAGFDRVYTYGPDMGALAEELDAQGKHAGHFDTTTGLVERLTEDLKTDSTILLKGSKRATDFRDVRDHLQKHFAIDTIAASVTVTGKVQGVGYRKWARAEAERLGLKGWIRNSDESVEIHVQGPRNTVREFLETCHQGPDSAEVTDVSQREVRTKQFTRFRVRNSVKTEMIQAGAGPERAAGKNDLATQTDDSRSSMGPAGFEPSIVAQAFGSQKLSAFVLALESWRRGLTVKFQGPDGSRFTVTDGARRLSFHGSKSSLTTPKVFRVVEDKHVTLSRLRQAGVPVPKSRLFLTSETSSDGLIAIAKDEYRWPVVVKPVSGSRGDGVFSNITSTQELRDYYEHLVSDLGARRILLEEHISGDDYRLHVVGDNVVGAIRRAPAHVVGDGHTTVAELITAKNAVRRKNPFVSTGIIRRDVEIDRILNQQGLDYESVPSAGAHVQLREKANVSAGGDSEDVTNDLPQAIKSAAITAVAAIHGLPAGAVDLLWDKDRGTGPESFAVIELNSRAHIGVNMYPTSGRGPDIPKALIDHLFPQTSRDADEEENKLSLTLNLDSLLQPMRDGTATHVEVAKLPSHAYPIRRAINLDSRLRLSSDQRSRILAASRRFAVAGSLETHAGTSRLVAAGEEQGVNKFLSRLASILRRDLTEYRQWHGTVMMGFYFSDKPLLHP